MTGRELLKSIRNRRYEVLALEDSVKEVDTRLTRISPVLSDMPKASGKSDKIGDGVVRLTEIKEKLNVKIEEAASYELLAMELIAKLENPIYRTILYRMYIIGEPLKEVAENINYAYNYACALHGFALNEIDKINIS